RLPLPGGPTRRYACTGCAADARSCATARSWPMTPSNGSATETVLVRAQHPAGHLVDTTDAVDHHPPLGVRLRQLGEPLCHPVVEPVVLVLHPVAPAALLDPAGPRLLGRHVEQHHQVGPQAIGSEVTDAPHLVEVETP